MPNKYVTYLRSPIGQVKLTGDETSVNSILFVFDDTEMEEENLNSVLTQCKKELLEYFAGKRNEFTVPIKQEGTEFQQKVWTELEKIPYGKTVSYNFIAESLGDKKAIRAVGAANGRNQISIIVPCHRVIGSDGSLTGYAGGMWRKKWLLNHEKEFSGGETQMEMF
ncbi:MAG: methylated-DNA--[protein]-cysteine S-methyltransferase [Ignavibacteriales bacterium]|nr:methylated-DNA--[protein]-cysteine S-methyltransferase [Ignavibacteriales bacterium]MCB9209620.1 methylated-DNA--[protein]-cysteine S-methyltransferase [Ignavibacteriales bacterium]